MARKKPDPAPVPPPPPEPKLLTPEVQAAVCKHVADGVPLTFAAALAGISPRSLFGWLKKGRAEETPNTIALLAAVTKARAEAVALRISRIAKAAQDGSWQADAWHLERTSPEHFGSDRRELRELRKTLADLTERLARLASKEGTT
jgi:hypothetical protein